MEGSSSAVSACDAVSSNFHSPGHDRARAILTPYRPEEATLGYQALLFTLGELETPNLCP